MLLLAYLPSPPTPLKREQNALLVLCLTNLPVCIGTHSSGSLLQRSFIPQPRVSTVKQRLPWDAIPEDRQRRRCYVSARTHKLDSTPIGLGTDTRFTQAIHNSRPPLPFPVGLPLVRAAFLSVKSPIPPEKIKKTSMKLQVCPFSATIA